MSWRHASDRRLLRWSEMGRGRWTALHLLHCSLCERRVETLTSLTPEIRAGLEVVTVPPPRLSQTMTRRLAERMLDQETLVVMADLLDLGRRTTKVLLEAGEAEEDG